MRTIIALLMFIAGFVPWNDALAGEPKERVFLSPSGRHEVVFTEVKRVKASGRTMNVDDVSHVVYRVEFLRKAGHVLLVSMTFNDVYGWTNSAEPTPIDLLFKAIIWSPGEDFALLPSEDWASAPGTEIKKAVALNTTLPWKTSEFGLDNIFWIDDFSVIGELQDDCQYEVSIFNGKSGKTVPVKRAKSPIGYELLLFRKNTALIMQVMDNCKLEDKPPVCFFYDLATKKENKVPCTTVP